MSPHPHSKEPWELLDAMVCKAVASMRCNPGEAETVLAEFGQRGVALGDTFNPTPDAEVLELVLRRKAKP